MNAPAVSFEVAKRFQSLRHRYWLARLGIALTLAVAGLLAIWLVLATCDYLWELPILWRKAGLASAIAVVAVWLCQRVHAISIDAKQRPFANLLEHSFADFGQRIRTVLDTVAGRVSGPSEMLAALGHQTLGRWETLSPTKLIPVRLLATCGGVCLAMIIAAMIAFVIGGDFRTAMLRAVASDLPYTSLAVTPGNSRVLEKSAMEVSLELIGRVDRDVMLKHRVIADEGEQQEWIESELLAVKAKGDEMSDPRRAIFSASLGNAAQAIEYQFVTSIGDTDVYRIDVQPLIDALRIEMLVEPPAYTRLEARAFAAADVTVLAESKVTVTVETNHPLGEAKLEIGNKPTNLQSVKMAIGDDRTRWIFELPSQESLHWHFSGHGDDGTPMTPVKGRLRVRQDEAPSLAWRDPSDEIKVHGLAELPMRVQVADDYGISEAGIVFQIGGDEDYVLVEWKAEEKRATGKVEGEEQLGQLFNSEGMPSTTRLKLEEVLPLESFALSERDYISYYAYAVDNRGSRPQRVETDVRYIDIRPLRQYFSEIELDPANGGGSNRILVQLDEIIRRQRFLINRTRKIVRSGNADLTSQLGTIDRMVESQSELAGLTRFLAEFFVSRGNDDVEALNQAEAAMLQAADSLAAGSFDLALVQEEDALRALAEGRRTLELFLIKNATPQQQQQLRQFARQLQQKLRRERPETLQQLADTLQKIAGEQSQLGQSAKQQEDLYAKEVELLERLQAVEEQLSDSLNKSPLMATRMKDAKVAMDSLATAARGGEAGNFTQSSEDAADQLREISLQLDALAAVEAVSRISSIRDMTTSMANMEGDLAEQLRTTNVDSDTNEPTTENSPALTQAVRKLQRRSETIEDVLKAPVEVGDVETSEVNDFLQRFVEDNSFMEQLTASREAAKNLSGTVPSDTSEVGQAAYQRALEFADAAVRLDELYRQMVAPRLARLREIEQRASNLAQQLAGGGKAAEESSEAKTGVGKLKEDLEAVGMTELAEMLDEESTAGQAEEGEFGGTTGSSVNRFDTSEAKSMSGRTLMVVKELRSRIQEMILLEISADRDTAVPAEYRTAVDQYFRVLAGDGDEQEEPNR